MKHIVEAICGKSNSIPTGLIEIRIAGTRIVSTHANRKPKSTRNYYRSRWITGY